MSTTASADFICSKCKKGYTWYADFAGKVARCTCGAVIQFPFTDPKPKDPLAIAFLPRTIEEQTHNGPAPMELPKEDLDPRILAERRALGEYFEDAPVPVDQVRDVHVPFALLAIGLLLVSWQVADLAEGNGFGTFVVLAFIIGSVVELGMSLLGVMLAGKLMGVYFGKAKTAFYKLTALYVAPGAIGMMLTNSMGDDAVGKVVGTGAFLVLYWGLFTFMFRIKGWQTLVCVGCILLVRFVALMCVVSALAGLFMARGIH
ncbi:MAG TPA: hypothetical protein VGP99_12935 [Tepidisphaeraceae bacterium]|jgi:hypothetical protein|nr:hypothetical protein [Tepidisphaeraceae bacterium]